MPIVPGFRHRGRKTRKISSILWSLPRCPARRRRISTWKRISKFHRCLHSDTRVACHCPCVLRGSGMHFVLVNMLYTPEQTEEKSFDKSKNSYGTQALTMNQLRFSDPHVAAVGRGPTKLEIEHRVASGHAQHRSWCDGCVTARRIATATWW